MSKEQFPNKILWLASYPKSGNTWFRAFLSALMNDGKVEINNMDTDGIFSARGTFDHVTDLDSRDLYDEEAKTMIADVYRYIANQNPKLKIVKVHDMFGQDINGNNIIPEDVTQCAIYIIRNPLDIAGSLANHMQCTIDEAVSMLNNDKAYLARQRNNANVTGQLPQLISDWSTHVKSWTTKPSFPVFTVRYEDMLSDSINTFGKVLEFIGLDFNIQQLDKAISASSFAELRKQEGLYGFKEKFGKSNVFFRYGTANNWGNELNENHIFEIKVKHKELLDLYGY